MLTLLAVLGVLALTSHGHSSTGSSYKAGVGRVLADASQPCIHSCGECAGRYRGGGFAWVHPGSRAAAANGSAAAEAFGAPDPWPRVTTDTIEEWWSAVPAVDPTKVLVEFGARGKKLPLARALDLNAAELPIDPAVASSPRNAPADTEVLAHRSDVVLLIAITSDCCSARAAARREVVRATWAGTAHMRGDATVRVRFVLAQPKDGATAARWAPLLSKEAAARGDIVFVRGADTYHTLPNKTLRTLRYAHYMGATHLLKTDDDCFVRVERLLMSLRPWNLQRTLQNPSSQDTRMTRLYLGGVENPRGFRPVRDPKSKWFISPRELPDESLPIGIKYAAGWGYLLSADVLAGMLATVDLWESGSPMRPAWFGRLDWEDVLIGAIAHELRLKPERHGGFQSAWQRCANDAVVRHLDVDAPRLMEGLAAQDASGLWDQVTIRCSSGKHMPGNYQQWITWRNNLKGVDPL